MMTAFTSHTRSTAVRMRMTLVGAALAVLVTLVVLPAAAAVTRVELDTSVQANATSTTQDGAGNPVVVYNDFNREQMYLVRCADPGCGSVGPVQIPDPRPGTGRTTAVAVAPGDLPVIAYFLDLNGGTGGGVVVGGGIPNDVVLARCVDPSCSSATTVTVDGSSQAAGGGIALFLDGAGNPTVVYGHRTDGTVVLRCDDPLCDGAGETRTTILADYDFFGAALDPSGNPVVAVGGTVVHCNDPGCTGADEAAATFASLHNSTGVAVDGAGNPVVVGRSASSAAPVVVRCEDPACASATETELTNARIQAPNVTLNGQGNPVVTVEAANGAALGVVVCTTPTCTGAEVPVALTQPNTGYAHLDFAPDGRLVVITDDRQGDRRPLALTCDDPACTVGVAPPSGSLTPGQEAAIAHAIALSQERFPEAPSNVTQGMAVIATVENFADALAGTGLLGPRPLLLTGSTTLHPDVAAELTRLNNGRDGGRRIILLGGTAALSESIETTLANAGWTVIRLGGGSRIETSAWVASYIGSQHRDSVTRALARAYPADGNPTSGWADSITYGGYAAEVTAQVILAPQERGHPTTEAYIGGEVHEVVHLVGGSAAVPSSYDDVPKGQRVEGSNRFDTARQIAAQLWQVAEEGPRTYLILDATDELGWAYGLPAAGLSADLDAPILVVGDTVPPETLQAVSGCGDEVELRGVGPVDDAVMAELDAQDAAAC